METPLTIACYDECDDLVTDNEAEESEIEEELFEVQQQKRYDNLIRFIDDFINSEEFEEAQLKKQQTVTADIGVQMEPGEDEATQTELNDICLVPELEIGRQLFQCLRLVLALVSRNRSQEDLLQA